MYYPEYLYFELWYCSTMYIRCKVLVVALRKKIFQNLFEWKNIKRFSIHNHKPPLYAAVYLFSKFWPCSSKSQTFIPHPTVYFHTICWISYLKSMLIFLWEGSKLAKVSNHYTQLPTLLFIWQTQCHHLSCKVN